MTSTRAGSGLLSKPFLALSDLLIAQDAAHGALPTLFAATEPGLTGGEYIGPDGLRQYRGSPTIVAPRRLALDSRDRRSPVERQPN